MANTSLSSPFLFILLSSQRLILPVSLVSSPFLCFLPPAVGIPFQSTYKPCCSETGCPSSNTEFPTSTVDKSLFRPLFPSPHSPTSRSWVYISEPDNLNLYRRSTGHFTCPLSSLRFAAVKPYVPFFVSSLAVDGFAPGLLWLFQASPAVKASIPARPLLVSFSSID